MSGASVLLVAALLVPAALLAACLSARARRAMPGLLALAPLPALAAAFVAEGSSFQIAWPGLAFALDRPAALLLAASALLWAVGGLFVPGHLRGSPAAGRFVVFWLMTLTGNIGVFLAADLAGFYLAFALASLSAYGLICDDGTRRAFAAGAVYVSLAILGEAFLLAGLILLALNAPGGSLAIGEAVAALPTSPWRVATLALIIAGLGVKIGLFPLHVWMPLAYTAAPIPAAAVMSGAVVKAGVIGLVRFLPPGLAEPSLGHILAWAGLFSTFYGALVGLTQSNPRTVLAYSSISQMGLVATVFGMGLAAGDNTAGLAAAFYGANHVLIKGALFLAIGLMPMLGPQPPRSVILLAALMTLSLAGLPPTGGALAKLAVKGPLGSGLVGMIAGLSGVTSTLLMLHFLRRLFALVPDRSPPATVPGDRRTFLLFALAALTLPWSQFPLLASGSAFEALAPANLWTALWPILTGAGLAFVLKAWSDRLPPIPAGDIVALAARSGPAIQRAGQAVLSLDAGLRNWPMAGMIMVGLALILGVLIRATI